MKDYNTLCPFDQDVIKHALEVVKDMINEDLEHLLQVKHIRTTYDNITNDLLVKGSGIVGKVNVFTEVIQRCQDHVKKIDEILNGSVKTYELGSCLGSEFYYRPLICPNCNGHDFKTQDRPHPNNANSNLRRCIDCNATWRIDVVESRINFTEVNIIGSYDTDET